MTYRKPFRALWPIALVLAVSLAACEDEGDTEPDAGEEEAEPCGGNCTTGVLTECTCDPSDPCGWRRDGFCDIECWTTGVVDVMFNDSEDCPSPEKPTEDFYSKRMGSCQRLWNGNTLLVESESGHVFEVTPEGERVWDFYLPKTEGGEGERPVIYRMSRIRGEGGGGPLGRNGQ